MAALDHFFVSPVRTLGATVGTLLRGPGTDFVVELGKFSRFAYWTVRGIPFVRDWSRGDRLRSQLYFVGTTSVPVLVITGAFIGMILAIEGYLQFAAIGQEGRLGGVINISLTKQIGPVLAAVMLAGRVGCSLTAELGTMRVTEQIDAMRAMAADPIRVLVIPRVVACVLMIPILTVVSNLCGVLGGWAIVTKYFHADASTYWRYTAEFVAWTDLVNGLSKSFAFGLMIGLISCYKGFNCRAGAEGVGRATTDSFVTSFIAIIISNLFLAKILNDFDLMYHGGLLRKVFG
ncbi:MAG: ABC transporter permease [Phycisphaeraceae bacterium]|nr:ABC transporter permease [Phycisphaerae bacterium]MBX3392413.1 ABC transporter permease [Phycisphaeraceae bacterium]HRJ49060.1 ABC transporter permease [Phycisphaerales bacterium]